MIVEAAVMGLLGGMARAAVGILKAVRRRKKLVWAYTLTTIICSAAIGAVAGLLFDTDFKISIIAGYAGTDLLENIYKITFKRKV